MKTVLISFLMAGTIFFTACTNNQPAQKEIESVSKMKMTPAADSAQPEEVTPTFAQVDPKAAASVNEIVSGYLAIKNALANDNASDAAQAAKGLQKTLNNANQSAFTAEQKKLFADNAEDLKEHAEHISKKSDDIAHQREHFSMMSEDVFDLVKGFGAGQTLYQDHCPMAMNDKGADWVSETKEIHNPYLGNKMKECGSVEKVIK